MLFHDGSRLNVKPFGLPLQQGRPQTLLIATTGEDLHADHN